MSRRSVAGSSLAVTLYRRGRAATAARLGIDPRALAAFRVALGCLLLSDLLLRSRHLVTFYADAGVLPRRLLFELHPAGRYSLHAVSGDPRLGAALFLAAGALATALVVGYRTRLATVGSLLLLLSLHARNPLVLNGGDVLLRRLLLWGALLPLSERWSIDARGSEGSRSRVATVASAGLLIQVVLVYTVAGLFKLRSPLWTGGSELRYLFRIDGLTVFLGDALAGFPAILRVLTYLWLGMLLSSVLLVALTGWTRALLVALFGAMHLGMLFTMRIGLFPLVSLAGLVPFLPPRFWDLLEASVPGTVPGVRSLPVPFRRGPTAGIVGSSLPGTPRPDGSTRRRLVALLAAGLLVGSLAWNAMSLGYVATPDRLAGVRDPAENRWDMFAGGRRADGWFVAPGRLRSGGTVDALHGGPVTWDRPPDLARTYPSARWLRYSLALRGHERLQRAFAASLCRRWNARHDGELRRVAVYFNRVPVRPGGTGPVRRIELATKTCA